MTAGFLTRFLQTTPAGLNSKHIYQLMEMLRKHPFLGDFTLPITMDTYLSNENAKKPYHFMKQL